MKIHRITRNDGPTKEILIYKERLAYCRAYGLSEEKAMGSFAASYLDTPKKDDMTKDHDPINNPHHYTAHPSGIECIQITEHMGFCLGNAIKYIFRADHKGNALEDLKKARWYIDREIQRREKV
jgi:hypothetical protein